jgi:hypothetical protein
MEPEPAKLASPPPENVTSLNTKSVTASVKVKVKVATSPALSFVLSVEIATEGAILSVGKVLVVIVHIPEIVLSNETNDLR